MLVVISFTILVGLPNAISDFGLNQQAYTGIKTKAQGFFAKTHIGWPFGNRKQQPFENLSECNERLHDVSNAHVKCTNNFCKVMCFEGYKFPSGETVLHMACKNNVWVIQNSDLSDITDCEPICGPPCENNGICIAPGECRCPENYFGPRCEIRKKLCLTRPPVPKNSRIVCNAASCSVTCARGFFFPDGSTITNLKCVEGQWIPTRQDFNKVPDCQPTCEPPCENGGNCLGHNVCECINDFKGPQCQYSVDRCSPKKMLFNGGYNCHGDNFVLTCQLYCPSNIDFEFPPATLYTCKFSKGYFEPRNIPQCVYGENVQIIGVGGKYDKKQEHKYKIDSQPQDISSWEATIKKIINKRKNIPGVKTHFDYSTSSGIPNVHILYNSPKEKRVPSPGICFTWGGNHVKTFDGLLFKFPIYCSHVLVRDHVDEEFSIVYKTCPSAETDCAVSLEIYFQDTLYTLTTKNDVIVLSTPKKRLPIPVQLIGIKVIHVGQQLKIDLEAVGLVILWDGKHYISIEANAGLWNRTSGLCGTLDMSSHNDFMSRDGSTASTIKTFIDSWKIVDDRDKCTMESLEEFRKEKECTSDEEIEAAKFCTKLLGTEQLQECLAEFDKALLAEYCMEEYCNCHSEDNPSNCNCNAFSVFVKECQFKGNQLRNGWRSSEVCPMKCDKERVYMPCGPATDTSCGSAVENAVVESCNEGCFCPEGTLQHQGKCIPIDQCPCRLRNKVFEAGSEVKKDCNTCLCKNGIWTCTDISCGARCSAVGDPHYITFDGRRFDFMGKCSYYLMKTHNISIESENIVCPGSISESMNFEPTSAIGMPSCTKSVTIRFEINGKEIAVTLDQGNAIYVNNKQVTEYPKVVGNGILTIRKASTIIISVDFADGLRVWWDGMTRVYIDAPSSYRGKTQGLCGTFNSNMQDDFLTPEGDIENSVEPFADKWKTKDTCDFTSEANPPVHPCQDNLEKKEKAEKYCTKLIGEIFEGCHWSVDPTPYFEDCMFDVCACRGDASLCLCPIFASYGAECNRQGVITNWRYHVKECAIECPLGQIFDECGDSCLRTCEDLASKDVCRGHCVEGCRCPPGQYLNSKNECIPEEQCQCMYDGLNFNNGYKEVRPGRQFLELCTCSAGLWDCEVANHRDRELYPPASEMKEKCAEKEFAEFTKCLPVELKTCKNMHAYNEKFDEDCNPGCVCMDGYVLDVSAHKCVSPENCSCHHGGKSYNDGDSFKEDCTTCKCKSGKWDCISENCAATCSVWGDSHFTTFDKMDFDFQGVCDYVLSKGTLSGGDGFSVTIQNVLCGTMGVTCSKSAKISLFGQLTDSILLSSDSSKSKHLENSKNSRNSGPNGFAIYKSGIMTTVEVTGLGLQIKWDHGTRLYVKLSDQWKGRTSGLCGNYNNDAQDDMINPSQGQETSSLLFGHSWRLQEFCSLPSKQIAACSEHPERKLWAHKKCGILKSKLFQPCHSEVSIDRYFKRCIFDACACDKGGDCECLCTAIAAYADECASKGTPIKWRSPEFCPMQCDESCSVYSSCISACPLETCDNYLEHDQFKKMCSSEACVEGCSIKPCKEGYVYSNSSYTECVPKKNCKPICMEKDGTIYYEGDIIRADECHTCRCSRQKEMCSGAPCSQTQTPEMTAATERLFAMEESQCTEGWTDWSNADPAPSFKKTKGGRPSLMKQNDIEPIPKFLSALSLFGFGSCAPQFMKKIECRVVGTNQSVKDTEDNSYCSLEKGLICIGPCHDYEIRVYCDCGRMTTAIESFTEASTKSSMCSMTDPFVEYPNDCFKFQLCEQQADGSWDYVEKTCGPTMMFNPVTKSCDWKSSVQEIKPFCKKYAPELVTTTEQSLKTSVSEKIPIKNCDPETPHVEYPGDCFKFRHCVQQSDHSWQYTEKTCGPTMMFNPSKLVCDWPANVLKIKPQCGTIEPFEEAKQCPEGQEMSDCGIPCGKACHYYQKQLYEQQLCKPYSASCEPGCIEEGLSMHCNHNELRRDKRTCVKISDCPCMSHSGKFVKPNDIFEESECEICQCLDNSYVCSKLPCEKEELVLGFTTPSVEEVEISDLVTEKSVIVPTVVTPPKKCSLEMLAPVIDGDTKLPDSVFTASSILGSSFLPQFSRLNSRPTETASGSWSPMLNEPTQYLQITLPKAIPLYGVIMQGSPIFDQYVTSFKILYSFDGDAFHYVTDESSAPQLFNGPIDPRTPIQSIFKVPIEAKIVRICPIKWHGGISIRVELLGCSRRSDTQVEDSQTETTTSTPFTEDLTQIIIEDNVEPLCDEPMGIENGEMSPRQVSSSSIRPNYKGEVPNLLELLKLTSPNGWQPTLNSPNEFIMFDFLELRNITGLKTQGGQQGWVTAFSLLYSNNGYIWNQILTKNGVPKIFLSNNDAETPKTNYFKYPIQTRYIKIAPIKWENVIEMKVEPLGCFIPYSEVKEPIVEVDTKLPIESIKICPVCPGVDMSMDFPDGSACKCEPPKFWNGKACSDRSQCPCFVGHIRYDVGAQYQSDDCSQCVCVLGGVPQCKPQKCPPCKEGLRPGKSINCACTCESCPEFQKLCPTSGDCILESFWCNGIQDCADDELNCTQVEFSVKETPNRTDNLNITKVCPEPQCPPGMKIESKKSRRKMSPIFESSFKSSRKGGLHGNKYQQMSKSARKINFIKTKQDSKKKGKLFKKLKFLSAEIYNETSADDSCFEFTCTPLSRPVITKDKKQIVRCPNPECPSEYYIEEELTLATRPNECPKYTCVLRPQKDAVCLINGRSFKTFDGTEYKYEICNHTLARDMINQKWSIILVKNCSEGGFICRKQLIVNNFEENLTLVLNTDLTVTIGQFKFLARQLEKSPLIKSTFEISQPGNAILLISMPYGFWLSYDTGGNVKIGVSSKIIGAVDGLCGYFNDIIDDDKSLPNGTITDSTMEFGDSWFIGFESNEICKPQACAKDIQKAALEICNSIRDEIFRSCESAVDYNRYISKCIESTCDCMKSSKEEHDIARKQCKCDILGTFVRECIASKPNLDIPNWRLTFGCEIACSPPFVYNDCFKRKCEPSCENMKAGSCPPIPNVCFAGCYCPEGMVREGKKCIPISECMDCNCDGFGKSKYITFDRQNFTFEGNCTYLLSRNILPNEPNTFEVYVKLGSCKIHDQKHIPKTKSKFKQRKLPSGSNGCILGLYILNEKHTVQLQKDIKGKFNISIDGDHIESLPFKADWIHMKETTGQEILVSLIRATVQIMVTYPDLAFTIRLPSAKYGSKLEGLCGDCNGDPYNDLQINPKQQQETTPELTIENIVDSWQNDKLYLGSDEKIACSSKQQSLEECVPPPTEKDPCMKIMDQDIFGQCHILVDPTMYASACQDEICKAGNSENVICETLSAYAKECFRHGICIDWRKAELCPFKCPSGLNYKPCSCIKTCDVIKERGISKTIKLGTKSSLKNIESQKLCTLTQMEGCICPDGQVLNGTKCIREQQCVQCDDGHYAGDTWRADKCTECNCDTRGKIICTKQECSVIEKICEDGFTPVETSDSDACCSKFICVPIPTVPTPITCPKPLMPACGPDQLKKSKTGPDNCVQYFCECKPFSECAPANLSRELKVGEVIVNNSMGCCPTFEILCDESKCPIKPNGCEKPFHEIIEKKEEGNCCREFLCVPPKDACLVPTNDTTLLKKIGEKWHSNQPCLSYTCSYGPDGLPLVIGEKKVCETTCNEGFEYIVEEGKCCGNCIQTMCNYNQTFYKPGDIWYSDDNCTTFKCEIRETNFFIEVSTETCPDVATCPDNQKYEDGCCIRCKLQPDSQKNCLPVSMVDTETVGIIQIYEGKHGLCKNKDVIYGFTECQGSCSSGSKFNPATHIQETFCHCCKPEKYDLLPVTLKCNDGSTTTKQIQIPSSCSCSPCSENIPFSEVDAEYVKIGKGVDAKKKYSTKNRGAKKG